MFSYYMFLFTVLSNVSSMSEIHVVVVGYVMFFILELFMKIGFRAQLYSSGYDTNIILFFLCFENPINK
jgi:hypothetical protein